MIANLRQIIVLTFACAFAWPVAAQSSAARAWKNTQGQVIQASYVSSTADAVTIRMADGKEHTILLSRLSAEDQAFVKTQKPAATAGTPTPAAPPASTNRVPVEKRVWPPNVEVPTRAIEITPVKENAPAREFVYQSEAFEFTSQAKLAGSMMKEVARTFEATKSLVEALPWGIVCKPPEGFERYKAALYETRNDYTAAGGPSNSGGVYMGSTKIFMIPFPSLGLELRGKTWYKDENYSADTLVHEITHQVMDDYLTFLPKWVIEGTAEYTESLPYKNGNFRVDAHKTGMRDHIEESARRGFFPDIPSLKSHMTMNRDGWDGIANSSNKGMGQLYFRSWLLVYYFCHLDGEKKNGARFIKFMEAVYGETQALRAFFADPRVKRFPDGRFSYPSSFPPPDMKPDSAPFKHLEVLLEGRSYSQIANEIRDAYKAVGVKISIAE
ncbi:MAG: hypothetical protein JNG86_20040 [Verrucomicrobiaceae bacterium]|nr:hypothetical protein [Verrucomicrobiaceae bacterium]